MPHDPARSCDLFFPFEKTVMQPIQEQFIEFALEADVLRFGEFKTKAGRLSPYFFNAGLFNTGALLDRLGEFYAKTLLAARDAGRIEFDMIFGPAYKGIPLAASVAMNLSRLGCDVPEVLGIVQLIEIARDLPVLYACKLHGIGKYPVASLFPVKFPCY